MEWLGMKVVIDETMPPNEAVMVSSKFDPVSQRMVVLDKVRIVNLLPEPPERKG